MTFVSVTTRTQDVQVQGFQLSDPRQGRPRVPPRHRSEVRRESVPRGRPAVAGPSRCVKRPDGRSGGKDSATRRLVRSRGRGRSRGASCSYGHRESPPRSAPAGGGANRAFGPATGHRFSRTRPRAGPSRRAVAGGSTTRAPQAVFRARPASIWTRPRTAASDPEIQRTQLIVTYCTKSRREHNRAIAPSCRQSAPPWLRERPRPQRGGLPAAGRTWVFPSGQVTPAGDRHRGCTGPMR